jgi:hypothetical protein
MGTLNHIRGAGRLALAGVAALTLAACTARPADPIISPGVPTGAATLVPTTPATAVPTTPATAVPTTAPTVAPTTAPTVAPTTAPRPGALVGPEWTVALQGDFDGNGRPDVIAYKPSAVRTSYDRSGASFSAVAAEAVLVERKADGTPWVRVLGDAGGLTIDGARVIPFTTVRPAAYVLMVVTDRRSFELVPLDAQGQQFTYPIGARYDAATGSYSRLGGEIPGGRPLLGPEWTVITEGDFDRNGRSDVVAFKPAAIASRVSTRDGYLASEIVVVERGADGSPVTRLLINRDGVLADNRPDASFGSGDARPAGMIVRLNGAERKLIVTPLNRAGEQYAQDVAVGYVDAAGRYVTYAPGGRLPLPLVGPEWSIAFNGPFSPGSTDGVVAYKPAQAPASNVGPGDFAVVASELVVVDRAASGGPAVRLYVTLDGITADGAPLASFTGGGARPAAIVARGSRADRSITLSLIDAGGQQYAQDVRVFWEPGVTAYRVAAPGGQQPQARQLPPGWAALASGDLNADGLADIVAYTPSDLVLVSGEVAAREVAILQAGGGGTEFQASVANGAIYAGGYLIYTFGDGSGGPLPAAYAVTLGGGTVALTPLAADGAPMGQPVELSWSPAVGAYVATPRPAQ